MIQIRILIVEDEKDLLEAIAEGLRLDGYSVDTCDNGEEAIELCSIENYDLMILDLNIPLVDGFEVLENVRKKDNELKILILSARSDISDKVKGLDEGANDYLTKPFDFIELEARIRNLLRRTFIQKDNIITFNKISMDLKKREIFINDVELKLTRKEISILEYFLLNPHRVISQEELIEHAWDRNTNSFSGSIRVHIASLRKKIKNILTYDIIYTKVGIGYYLSEKGGIEYD